MMNRITGLFNIKYPIIQAGMIWCSGWKLASAVSNAGGLGLIGSGSMYPEILREHIIKCKKATDKPFGINVPLLYPQIDDHIKIILDEKVKIVFTSAGNPKRFTSLLKDNGVTVVHVVANSKFAVKCEESGVDAVVAEGFEAGGHNGIEETTTFCLIPRIRESISLPLIAAGGIATGKGVLAAFALGAEGVQIGSRFAASLESSAHENFKMAMINSSEGDTKLVLKKIIPVRIMKNKFYQQVQDAEDKGASADELRVLLGRSRAKLGMFDGDLDTGELEIGQISANIKEIKPAAQIIEEIVTELELARKQLSKFSFK